tara:strand:- start:2783 stop:3598 length:816 start_codon:yes stop_codon:yes gene_type:complete
MISFSLITNRPEKFKRFCHLFANINIGNCIVAAQVQDPFTQKDIWECESILDGVQLRTQHHPSYLLPDGRIDVAQARMDAHELTGDCEYVVVCDDDTKFKSVDQTAFEWSAADRFQDCIDFMASTPTCGGIQMSGALGARRGDRRITLKHGGFYETFFGLILRNPKGLIDPEFNRVGFGEDFAICFSVIKSGFGFYSAKNTPISKDRTTKVDMDGDPDRPQYCIRKSRESGFIRAMSDYSGKPWRFGGVLPKQLIKDHRAAAKQLGIERSY